MKMAIIFYAVCAMGAIFAHHLGFIDKYEGQTAVWLTVLLVLFLPSFILIMYANTAKEGSWEFKIVYTFSLLYCMILTLTLTILVGHGRSFMSIEGFPIAEPIASICHVAMYITAPLVPLNAYRFFRKYRPKDGKAIA